MKRHAPFHRSSQKVALICPSAVVWAKDAAGILAVDERRGKSRLLQGVECAVWNWLSLGYPYSELVSMTSEFLAAPPDEAERRLGEIFTLWIDEGLLEKWSDSGG